MVFRCKLLVVGAGAGGCSVTWRFSRILRVKDIIVLEPSKVHYYQPLFTLVASGITDISRSKRPLATVLPRGVLWLRDHAEHFDPGNNMVYTCCGHKVQYDFMVIGLGLKNDYDKIPGLKEALDNPSSAVSTIYSPEYCVKTWCCLQQFCGGHAVFTFPKQPGKCPGSAQKIMYLADDYWRKVFCKTGGILFATALCKIQGTDRKPRAYSTTLLHCGMLEGFVVNPSHKIRELASITYNTGTTFLFGLPKYANALENVASKRNIVVNCNVELLEVAGSYAVFGSENGQCVGFPYNFLHVTPPMSPPACLASCSALVTEGGYLDVDRSTLQHRKYSNIFGIGDCTSTPNSKTAAAVAPQSYVVERNLRSVMRGEPTTSRYGGYGACPILTSYRAGLLAEFQYDRKLCDTFPFDQSKERRFFYKLQTHCFPYLYWNKLIRGKWNGPSNLRKIINPFNK